jgi:sugar lactone lactonase YvrE
LSPSRSARRFARCSTWDSRIRFGLFPQPEKSYSWWDYRLFAFRRNMGLRIDEILLSAELAKACTACTIDRAPRKLEKPSDHAPVVGGDRMTLSILLQAIPRAAYRSLMRTIATGLRFPEGPIAMPDGTIVLVEIERGTLLARHAGRPAPKSSRSSAAGRTAQRSVRTARPTSATTAGLRWHEDQNGLRPVGQPDDYAGGRIERVDLATGAVRVLYTGTEKGPLKGPNDIVFDRAGGMWFTDLGKTREREMDRGGVYYATTDGSQIREVIYPMLTPNGIGLSPDESRLYVAETHTGRLWAFDLGRARGRAPAQVSFAEWRRARSPDSPVISCSIRSRSTPTATSAWQRSSTAASR